MRNVLVLSLGLVLMADTGQAQKVEFRMKDLQVCVGKQNSPDSRIEACTRLIQAFEGVRFGAGKADQILTTAFYNRASAYGDKGEYDRAIQDYSELILMDPNDYKAFINRGLTYHDNKGEYDRAIRDYDQAIRIRPDDAETVNTRGDAYQDKGEYDRAIQDYDQAIRMRPNFEKSFNNRGNAYRLKGEYERAIQDYDEAIRIRPDYALAFRNRGNAYRDKGEYDRAIQDYDQAIRLNPRYAFAFFERGTTRFLQGQLVAAVPDLVKCTDLAPRNWYMKIWLYIVRVRTGQKADEVLTAIRQLDLSYWPGPVVSLYLGTISAETALEATNNPDSRRQRSQLCEAHFYLGEYELLHAHRKEAAQRFQTALETCASSTREFQAAKEELKQVGL